MEFDEGSVLEKFMWNVELAEYIADEQDFDVIY